MTDTYLAAAAQVDIPSADALTVGAEALAARLLAGSGRLVSMVMGLIQKILHERYDPRPIRVGGQEKLAPDIGLVLHFLSVLYPYYSAASPDRAGRTSAVQFMDVTAAQHLSASLLFAARIANAIKLCNEPHDDPDDALAATDHATNPSSTTAAATLVCTPTAKAMSGLVVVDE